MRRLFITLTITAITSLNIGFSCLSAADSKVELSIHNEGDHAIKKGIQWIIKEQEEDGSWSSYPAITALVVSSLLRSPDRDYHYEQIDRGLNYIKNCSKPDGSIAIDNMLGYNTSVCIMALTDSGDPTYDETIKKGRNFLIFLQFDEGEGFAPDSCYYGGIGYGSSGRPDISNIQWALEALKSSEHLADRGEYDNETKDNSSPSENLPNRGESGKGIFWDKAILFLNRCQNFEQTNDQSWAGNDGGFVYYPGNSKAGGTTSYGSMTYAGLKSFIYADVEKEDPRVKAAVNWIRENYTLDENPEVGLQGLYYYYHTMAKALNIYGEEKIKDGNGDTRNWREDLIIKLCSLQNGDGYWFNSNGRWWENNKVLVTAYCILALEEVLGYKPPSKINEGNY